MDEDAKKVEPLAGGLPAAVAPQTANPAVSGAGLSEKSLFSKDSDSIKESKNVDDFLHKNLDEITNIDIRLVRLSNDVADIHSKMDEITKKIVDEIKNINASIANLAATISALPKETSREVLNIKKIEPEIYSELKQVVMKKVKATTTDIIDAKILKIIIDAKKIDSLDLLKKAEEEHACSKNTLYAHLTRLENLGMVGKSRLGHKIFYAPLEIPAKALEPLAKAAEPSEAAPGAQPKGAAQMVITAQPAAKES